MCHMCFWKYGVPTCGTRPGWRCRRRWAWLRGLWHTWDHSQSISLEKLDTKHVPYMFLMILTNSLSCFHWLSSSTSMGVSMTSNRVQTYFSVYTTVPRASPENFISLSWKLVNLSFLFHCFPVMNLYNLHTLHLVWSWVKSCFTFLEAVGSLPLDGRWRQDVKVTWQRRWPHPADWKVSKKHVLDFL